MEVLKNNQEQMYVLKRNGKQEEISFDKILNRIKKLSNIINSSYHLNELKHITYAKLVMHVIQQLYDNIPTQIIDKITAEQCASMTTEHLDYDILAGRIMISNHHKETESDYLKIIETLWNVYDYDGKHAPLISKDTYEVGKTYHKELNEILDYDRDYLIDYFGFKTLERAYLMKVNKKIVERPQHMWMRVAIGIHGSDLSSVKETYDLMSMKYFTHATPTLFNAGTPRSQLSSCYLVGMEEDSIEGIYNTLKECGQISKWAGGIGLHIHNVRAKGTRINGTNGISNGIIPMLRVFNETARYIDQGGGKRKGSFAIYLEPWHADICDFLELKKNHGKEELKARDLFYGLWIPSLFMERVKENKSWHLFCPYQCPGLADVYGNDFNDLYWHYVNEKKFVKEVSARELWFQILDSQMETGVPYLLYKDTANMKSNQKNLGVIKSSNLCTEIIEYSDEHQTAVCNLASIALSSFVDKEHKTFDYNKLHQITKVVTRNLNKVIDVNFYPTPKTKRSNLLHRPIGIGVQGLADTFALLDIPFHSKEAREVNKQIFETIYHASLQTSNEIAKERMELFEYFIDNIDINQVFNYDIYAEENKYRVDRDYNETYIKNIGFEEYIREFKPIPQELLNYEKYRNAEKNSFGSYSSFIGSPASNGILQFDLWNVSPSTRYDWDTLKQNIITYGLRNSLLVAPMPTASTAQILGNNECFEPFTSNIYTRRTLAGEYILVNKYLMRELQELGLWSVELKNSIIKGEGSIQHIKEIPDDVKEKYKIAWEIPMKFLIDMAIDRGAYICQSQSLNLWVAKPNYKTLTNMHFYSWEKGLKTGIYYLRRKAEHKAQQFTIAPENNKTEVSENNNENNNENIENNDNEGCIMCSG